MSKKIYIAPWDPDSEVNVIKLPKQVPEGQVKHRPLFAEYFSSYINPKSSLNGKETRLFLKTRFITDDPEALPFPINQLGQEIGQEIPKEFNIMIKKQPYACQAPSCETLGWLHGSTKFINSATFVAEVKKVLAIPDHVELGVQWRVIKDQYKKAYAWNNDDDSPDPPQALHIEIDKNYANLYYEKAAVLWKKSSRKKILGMQLRLVPCFSSSRAIAMSDIQKHNTVEMAAKQQALINDGIVKIETSHILDLDFPIECNGITITLREYLMSRAPDIVHNVPETRHLVFWMWQFGDISSVRCASTSFGIVCGAKSDRCDIVTRFDKQSRTIFTMIASL